MDGVSVQKPQYSIGIITNGKTEIYYDLHEENWCIQIIKANALSDIIPQVKGDCFFILKEGDRPCYQELFSIYELMRRHPDAGGYLYRSSDKEEPDQCCQGDRAFRNVFLQSSAENAMVYNMKIIRQLDVAKWLKALKEIGNAYVADYEVSCCSYLIALASPIIFGNKRPGKELRGASFQLRYRYVDGITDLLTQWIGLVSNQTILDSYSALITISFNYLTLLDYSVAYISDTRINQVQEYLLENTRRISMQWEAHGISLEKALSHIRQTYSNFLNSPRISRILEKMFYKFSGYPLDLENPQTFNQKINWMKLYDNQEIKSVLCDKYAVRAWIKEKLGEQYLLPLIGTWDKAEDIDFNSLPEKFVLKLNHGSGFNIIVTDKDCLDKRETVRQLEEWMGIDYCTYFLEMQYKDIVPKIICEEYVENNGEGLHDYKIHVFNGEPQYIQYISGRADKTCTSERWFDTQWNPQDFTYTNPRLEDVVQKPQCLNELLKVARTLGGTFAYVRVDLYVLNDGQIKFGEMTFSPMSGMDRWKPAEMDLIMGEKIDIKALRREIEF